MNGQTVLVGAVGVVAIVNATVIASTPSYSIVDLGGLLPSGSVESYASGVNDAGAVVGSVQLSPLSGAKLFVWTPDGVEIIDDGSSVIRIPFGISGDGVIGGGRVGGANGWVFADGSFPCVPDPEWCTVPSFVIWGFSQVLAVSEAGFVAGGLTVTEPQFSSQINAFVGFVDEDGELVRTSLGFFDGKSTVARGVNDFGHSVGWTLPYTNATGFFHDGTDFTALPSLGGTYNRPDGMNNTGLAVGFVSYASVQAPHLNGEGAVWNITDPAAPTLSTIGQVPGVVAGEAVSSRSTSLRAINDAGVAVGVASFDAIALLEASRAIIWSEQTGLLDLNDLLPEESGWTLEVASSINSSGMIVGSGRLAGQTSQRAFLLIPQVEKEEDGGTADRPRRERERREHHAGDHAGDDRR